MSGTELVTWERYDGEGIDITIDAHDDGVPDRPSASLLRGKTGFNYDDQGRVYRTEFYSVNPLTGAVGGALTSQSVYDHRGYVIKTLVPGMIATKFKTDGAGRVTRTFVTDGGGDITWSDCGEVVGDIVFEQIETEYDKDGLAIMTTLRQRFHDEADTGKLETPSGNVQARVSFSTAYYDLAMRLTDSVDVGTNGGSNYTRPSTVPSGNKGVGSR